MLKNRFAIIVLLSGLMLGATFLPAPVSVAYAQKAFVEEPAAGVTADHQVAETGVAHGEDHAADVGFPQLNTKTYASQVFWLFISFALLYTLMSKLALPRVGEVLEMRNAQKNGNLNRAEEMQEEAAKLKTSYEASLNAARDQAQDVLGAANDEITDNITKETARFGEHARKRIANAEQNIEKAKADALVSLADISAEIAAEMANKIGGLQISKADAKKAVTAAMQKEA